MDSDLKEDVINALANYRLLQMKNKDYVGCALTTELIERIKEENSDEKM